MLPLPMDLVFADQWGGVLAVKRAHKCQICLSPGHRKREVLFWGAAGVCEFGFTCSTNEECLFAEHVSSSSASESGHSDAEDANVAAKDEVKAEDEGRRSSRRAKKRKGNHGSL